MWSQFHGSSMYKRMTSRDNMDPFDVEDHSSLVQNGTEQETSSPAWKLSFPHVLVATIVSFLFGYHLGVVNEPLESIAFDLGFNGNTLAEGLVVSTCLAGAFIGSLSSGWIADGVGRRRAFQLCAIPMFAGAALCATATTLTGMLLGRFLVGTGLGVGPAVASLYVTELSPAHVRGTYGSFIQIATCLGLMASLLVGIPVKDVSGWWRYCFWISTIPAAILALAMVFCVESPHWLYKQGRIAEAEMEFERLLGDSHVKAAMAELTKLDRGDESDSVKFTELLVGRHSRVVFIGSSLFALQQLSGINAVFYFSSTVFRRAGVSSGVANVFVGIANLTGISLIFSIVNNITDVYLYIYPRVPFPRHTFICFVMIFSMAGIYLYPVLLCFPSFPISWLNKVLCSGSVVALILMDKLGRRILLLWSFFGMAIAMALQVVAASLPALNSGAFYLSITGMLMFVLTFSIGAGPVPGLLLPELLPNRIRAKAMAFCMSVHWVINFFVGLMFLRLLEQIGPQLLYTFFGTCCLMAVAFVKRNVVETKGKSLQEIEIALLAE